MWSVRTRNSCWYPEMENAWRQKRPWQAAARSWTWACTVLLMQYITESKVLQVAAFNDNQTFDYEVEDASTLLLRLANGAQCVVQSNFNIPDAASKWRLEFFGTRGRLLGDNVIGQEDTGTVNALFIGDAGDYNAQQDDEKPQGDLLKMEYGNFYTREIKSFSDSILNGKPLAAPAEDAIYVQRVIEAAYRSGEEASS